MDAGKEKSNKCVHETWGRAEKRLVVQINTKVRQNGYASLTHALNSTFLLC